jgi:predicted site-specific integrase-resolvase
VEHLQQQPPLTEEAAATRLGVSPHTLRTWRRKGQGPAYVRMGRAVRYPPGELDRYLAAALAIPGSLDYGVVTK